MTDILRRIRKNSQSKHTKLCEDWSTSTEPVCDGVTFYVKYLGSVLVEKSSGEEVTSEAIKTIITMAKKQDKKLLRVSLTIAIKGIKMEDVTKKEVLNEVDIYKISYCSADATYDHVFAFISTNVNETLECHAFLCPKRKMAQAATLTIAQAFNLAYEHWQLAQERRKRRRGRREESRGRRDGSRTSSVDRKKIEGRICDANDNQVTVAIVEKYDENPDFTEQQQKTTSPSSGYNSCTSGQDDETLLIDLSSPGDELGSRKCDSRPERTDLDPDSDKVVKGVADWVRFEDEDMEKSFAKLSTERSPAMLRRLPPSAAGKEFGALAGSPGTLGTLDSPYGSPMHGSNLTPSILMTPVGSPLHLSSTPTGTHLYSSTPPTRCSMATVQSSGVPNWGLSGSYSTPCTPQRTSSSPSTRPFLPGREDYTGSSPMNIARSPANPSPLLSSPPSTLLSARFGSPSGQMTADLSPSQTYFKPDIVSFPGGQHQS